MLLDDRLATVLRSHIGGDRAARTQYRQLLDLLGSAPADAPGELTAAAYARLKALAEHIPADEQSLILREPGLRLRNRRLVEFLADGDFRPAAAALATARLSDAEWLELIPQLPMVARGFLRHRRNLPASAKQVLERLGVRDLVLPEPAGHVRTPEALPEAVPETAPEAVSDTGGDLGSDIEAEAIPAEAGQATAAAANIQDPDGIRALLRRIETFRESRKGSPPSPRLPLGDGEEADLADALVSFEFTCDIEGRIDWASPQIAPLVIGMKLGRRAPGIIAALEDRDARAMVELQPLRGAQLVVDGAPVISGEWRVDAQPSFAPGSGAFSGYLGRIYRPAISEAAEANAEAETAPDSPGERMRQVLHELRTPVNAIQGFAEIIQQQLFGHAPNEYRALAAAVTVDSAKLLAAFDEVDRLSKLETGALEPGAGESDLHDVVTETIRRLDGVLRPRNSAIALEVRGSPFTTALARDDLLALGWRILASLAGALAPSETITAELDSDGEMIALTLQLPEAIAAQEDRLATRIPEKRPAISAGMFGTGFSFRLSRAEIIAAGGTFAFVGSRLAVTLPLLTDSDALPSTEIRDDNAA